MCEYLSQPPGQEVKQMMHISISALLGEIKNLFSMQISISMLSFRNSPSAPPLEDVKHNV